MTFFLTGTDESTDMARWIFEIAISSDHPCKVMCSVPGVAGDGSRDLYHYVGNCNGIFRAKYDTNTKSRDSEK